MGANSLPSLAFLFEREHNCGKQCLWLEQIKTIDKRRILSYIGKVSREEMRAVDEALQVSLDIHIPEEMEAP